jgi:hypothetical protein
LGGQEYIYAMRGDQRPPVQWVPAARQEAALSSLLTTLSPSELAIKRELLAQIPPRPSGYGRTRELFPRMTGGAFDPIAPATVAADMTISFILTPDRAARLVVQRAIDPSLPGLIQVLDRLITTVFTARTNDAYELEIKRAMERVLVTRLMMLAESAAMAQVRAIASEALREIPGRRLGASAIDPRAQNAHNTQLADDIRRFLDRALDLARPAPIPTPPPGAPIGDVGLDYLLGFDACGWRW